MVAEVQGAGANVGVSVDTAQAGLRGVHGSVTLNQDGSFSYDPPPGFTSGVDTFTYRVSNSGPLSNLATVTVNVSDVLWFVCSSCGGTSVGTLLNPFTSIGAFGAANVGTSPAPQPGARVYIRSGTYSAANDTLTLRDGQEVTGQGVAASSVITPAPDSNPAFAALVAGASPVLAPQAGDAIDLASNNTVRFVDVGSTAPGAAHLSGSAIGTLTLNNVNLGTLPSATGRPLALSNGSFSAPSVTLATLNSTGSSGGAAVSLTNLTGTLQINAGSVSNATGGAVLAVAVARSA